MGVEKFESCSSLMPEDMANIFICSFAAVKKVGSEASDVPLPRKCGESEEGSEKVLQSVSLLKEESGAIKPPVKESSEVEEEDKGRVVVSRRESPVVAVGYDSA